MVSPCPVYLGQARKKSIFFAPFLSLIIAEKYQIILIMFKNVLDPKAEFLKSVHFKTLHHIKKNIYIYICLVFL